MAGLQGYGNTAATASQPDSHSSVEKREDKLKQLCDDCRLKVSKTTFGRTDVIHLLGQVDRSFCNFLNHNIITPAMLETIEKAVTSPAALGHIRRAFSNCLDPNMFDEVQQALKLTKDEIAANKIKEAYYAEIGKYELCPKCRNQKNV